MLTAQQRLQRELRGATKKTIEALAARAFQSRDDIEDVIRSNEDGRKMLTNLLGLSDDGLKRLMGWTNWPEHCGVTLSGPCPLGGVLAPSESDMAGPAELAPAGRTASLPDHFSTTKHFQPPRNQGSVGTCTAFATIGTLEGQCEKLDLAERFVYYHTKKIDGHPDSDGSFLKYSVKVLAAYGACREKTWPYVEDRKALRQEPPSTAFREAKRYKPRSAAIRVAPKDVSTIRAEIASGHPVALSLPIFRSSYNSLRFHSEGRFLMKLGVFDSVAGYHAMCAVAFFDNAFLARKGQPEEVGGGAFLVRNSWGTTWAKNNPLAKMDSAGPGYAIVPFAYVQEYGMEAFTVAARASMRFDDRELLSVASSAGKAWWRRTRDAVVASARERLTEAIN